MESGPQCRILARADPQRLYLPPIMDAVYGYQSTTSKPSLAIRIRC